MGRMAEWLALQTGKREDSSSIPAKVKTLFGGIKSLEQYIACHFELNLNFELNFYQLKISFKQIRFKKIPWLRGPSYFFVVHYY